MKIIFKILKYSALTIISLILVFVIGGLIIKNQGQSDINEASLINDDAKIAIDKNGRKIEYFLYGSNDLNAPVIINIHGSGLDGTFEKSVHQSACEQLGIRGISISLPACGNTDMKIGRKVIEWASEDLESVLNQEKVDQFMITGHSQGNPHAMAAAYHFKNRCIGLGMNAPLLPNNVTTDIGIEGAIGYEDLKTTEELHNPLNSYWFFMIYLTTDLFSPSLTTGLLTNAGENVKKDTAFVQMMNYTFSRSTIRGAAGQSWESARDVCYDWGFDPREIDTKNICVWHASDDTFCPPEIGVWLSDYFTKKGAHVNFKNENLGFNHMTYCNEHYRKAKNSMEKALLVGELKKQNLR
jgi:pimeloyl-ACP methyl ester carboxylesterase